MQFVSAFDLQKQPCKVPFNRVRGARKALERFSSEMFKTHTRQPPPPPPGHLRLRCWPGEPPPGRSSRLLGRGKWAAAAALNSSSSPLGALRGAPRSKLQRTEPGGDDDATRADWEEAHGKVRKGRESRSPARSPGRSYLGGTFSARFSAILERGGGRRRGRQASECPTTACIALLLGRL